MFAHRRRSPDFSTCSVRLAVFAAAVLTTCAARADRWDSIQPLLRQLHDPNPAVAELAEARLAEMGVSPGAVELGRRIVHPDPLVREELARSLDRVAPGQRSAIVRALAVDSNPRVRVALVEAARDVELSDAAKESIRALVESDRNSVVRGNARLLNAEWQNAPKSLPGSSVPAAEPAVRRDWNVAPTATGPEFEPPARPLPALEARQFEQLKAEFDRLVREGRYDEATEFAADTRATFTPRSAEVAEAADQLFAAPNVEWINRSHRANDRLSRGLHPGMSVRRKLRPYWGADQPDVPDVQQTAFDDREPNVLNRPIGDEPGEVFDPAGPDFSDQFVVIPEDAPQGYAGRSSVLQTDFQTSPHFVPIEDRWRLGFEPWDRYGKKHPAVDDYPGVEGHWWDPYNLNVLKGDYPIIGQHTFFRITATSFSSFEWREVPTGTTPFESTKNQRQEQFFGDPAQSFINQNLIFQMDLFHGNAAFKPVDWQVRLTPVVNFNYLDVNELGIVNPDVTEGTRRSRDHVTLQEYFVEAKLADLGPDYDFVSIRAGNQLFNSDFRGHIFFDTNRGVRLFGTRFGNRDQFNLAFFDMVEKETNSELNTFDDRHQNVLIANYYRQDFIFPGYTAQASLHYNDDQASFKLDRNDFLVRPDPVGVFQPHRVQVAYLGFAGEGHIERFNVSHVLYWALGEDKLNPLAGRDQDIDAYMGAIELSYDRDWIRFRASLFYQSGDDDLNDDKAEGFDTIMDDVNFAGGNFSYWQRQGIRLFGANVTQRKSLVADLRSSKIQGQANFVNPGLALVNAGMDFEITPKVKIITNVNYLWFDSTVPLEVFTFQDRIDPDIGVDMSLGVEYRPLLSDNIICLFGVSSLIPAQGFDDIVGGTVPLTLENAGNVESNPLYAAFFELVMQY